MKKTLLAIVAALLLVSCSQNDEVREKKAIEFIVDGLEVDYTRATLADASITDLYIWEGETLLKHQVSTDADFGSPTIELDYGTHNLTFVASKSTGQSWASGKWTCTKVDDTFGRVMELQVAKGSSTSQSVELSRVIAKVQWTIEDKVPASAVSMDVSVTNYLSLTADLSGADATTYAVSGHNISSWAGIQGKQPCVSVIPATFGSESNAAATITFHKADESVICAYTKYVTVLSNRTTNIHGSFFAIQPTLGVSLNTSWADQKDVDL